MIVRHLTESFSQPRRTSTGKTYTDVRCSSCSPSFNKFVLLNGEFPYPDNHPDYQVTYFGHTCASKQSRDSVYVKYSITIGNAKLNGTWQLKLDNYISGRTLDLDILYADIMGIISAIQQSRVKPLVFLSYLANSDCSVSIAVKQN